MEHKSETINLNSLRRAETTLPIIIQILCGGDRLVFKKSKSIKVKLVSKTKKLIEEEDETKE